MTICYIKISIPFIKISLNHGWIYILLFARISSLFVLHSLLYHALFVKITLATDDSTLNSYSLITNNRHRVIFIDFKVKIHTTLITKIRLRLSLETIHQLTIELHITFLLLPLNLQIPFINNIIIKPLKKITTFLIAISMVSTSLFFKIQASNISYCTQNSILFS
jgi:hypothetical protein